MPVEIRFEVRDYEQDLLMRALEEFHDEGWLTEVLYRVKGGKEANVYCCLGNPDTGHALVAAKVYRPRRLRAMRNYGLYRQGRSVTADRRLLRALRKRTRTGKETEDSAWISHEFDTVARVYSAGADVPEPLAAGPIALLTAYVGDETTAAPLLHETTVEAGREQELFDRLIRNVALFLSCDLIHADLSAHNVLYWRGEVRVIDFPQAVDPLLNPSAFSLLARDVERLCQHFARYGVEASYADITADLWERYHRRQLQG